MDIERIGTYYWTFETSLAIHFIIMGSLNELTIFLVHLLDLPYILVALEDVKVRLIPESGSCKFRTWKLRERAEIRIVYGNADLVQQIDSEQSSNSFEACPLALNEIRRYLHFKRYELEEM
jgi:hypothetical protein